MSDSDTIKTGAWRAIRRIVVEPESSGGWSVAVENTHEKFSYSDAETAERAAIDLGKLHYPSIVVIRSADVSDKSERVFLLTDT
jgi:hypothetical protein